MKPRDFFLAAYVLGCSDDLSLVNATLPTLLAQKSCRVFSDRLEYLGLPYALVAALIVLSDVFGALGRGVLMRGCVVGVHCLLFAVGSLSCSSTAPPEPSSSATSPTPPSTAHLSLDDVDPAELPVAFDDHHVLVFPTNSMDTQTLSSRLRENSALQACVDKHPEAFVGAGGVAVLLFGVSPDGLVGPALRHYHVSPPELVPPSSHGLGACARDALKAMTFKLPSSGSTLVYFWKALSDPAAPKEGLEPRLR